MTSELQSRVASVTELGPDNSLALRQFLRPLDKFFKDDNITEICINRPREVWTETDSGWTRHELPNFDFNQCKQLATLIATYSKQKVDAQHSTLSATLPDGERCQIVLPPSTRADEISFTIRKPTKLDLSLDDYERGGAFDDVVESKSDLLDFEKQLISLKANRQFKEFINLAVLSRLNIIISGSTGSGKTTFNKAVIRIVPINERLVSIESVDELALFKTHPNSVALFYSSDGQGLAKAKAKDLLHSAMRMKPDRIFFAELIKGDEAFSFLDAVSSGHPGSITTMHSDSPTMCIERLTKMIRSAPDAQTMSTEDIKRFIYMSIDVIVQFKSVYVGGKKKRMVTEIYYDPEYKKTVMAN